MRAGLIFTVIVSAIFLNTGFVFTQELETTAVQTNNEPEILWLWGQIISKDEQNNTLKVKYLDYDTDTEKEISILVDENTLYENAKSLTEINPNDTVSIDYIVSPEGKSIAKNISVEKPETQETTEEVLPPSE